MIDPENLGKLVEDIIDGWQTSASSDHYLDDKRGPWKPSPPEYWRLRLKQALVLDLLPLGAETSTVFDPDRHLVEVTISGRVPSSGLVVEVFDGYRSAETCLAKYFLSVLGEVEIMVDGFFSQPELALFLERLGEYLIVNDRQSEALMEVEQPVASA